MNTFRLKLIAGNRKFFDGRCVSLTVPAYDGEMGILANHSNMACALTEGTVRLEKENGEKVEAVVAGGFVEIIDNTVVMLAHTIERPEEINVRRAREAKLRAEEQLRRKQSKAEYYHSRSALSRAVARLRATKK